MTYALSYLNSPIFVARYHGNQYGIFCLFATLT